MAKIYLYEMYSNISFSRDQYYRMKYFQCRETLATKRTKQVNLIKVSCGEVEHDCVQYPLI